MNKKIASTILFFCFSIFILNACSVIENVGIQNKLSIFNNQIKNGKFGEIYEESSNSLKSRISKEQFVSRIETLTKKMKTVDENLFFSKSELSEILSSVLNSENSINSFMRLENKNERMEILISWANENDTIKLTGFSLIQPIEDGKFRVDYIEGISRTI